MERPSHIDLTSSHPFSNRLVSMGLAVSLPLAALWVLGHGMAEKVFSDPGPLHYVPDRERPKHDLPPQPQTKLIAVPKVIADLPRVLIAPDPADQGGSVTVTAATTATTTPVAAGPDRAASGVAGTHTSPPYPEMARRMGENGTVTLHLTIGADGLVAKAEIVTSSGSAALDAAAQGWIVAHWRYHPALDKGRAVASQAQAVVKFDLRAQN